MSLLTTVIKKPEPSAPKGIIYGPPGIGKAQPLDARILTPNGYVAMGDLKVGDKVIGSNGMACRVIGIYPQGEKEVFRVTLLDGSSTECSNDHLWFTQTRTERQQNIAGAIRPLSTIRKTLKSGTHFNHAIPRVAPVQFDGVQALPIDPWLLGIYLGDGHSDTCAIITNPEPDIQAKIENKVPDGDQCVRFDKINLRISRKSKHGEPSKFMVALRNLDIANLKAEEKFIPKQYMFASIHARLSLLQGLCDSDGYVCGCGSVVEHTTVSPQLAQDVRFLAKSLGADVTVTKKSTFHTYKGERRSGQLAYRLVISMKSEIVPVSSKKHLEKWKTPTWSRTNAIRTVEAVGVKPCQCIKVDALDSLYVTDDFIVTHNTTFGALADASIIIDCENGAGAIQCNRTPYLSSWEEISRWLMAIEREEHQYQTLVIDSIDWLLRRIEEAVTGPKLDSTLNRSHGGYGNGKQVFKNHVYQVLLPLLDRIVQRGIAVILLAHAKRTDITDVEGVTVEKTTAEVPDGFLNVFVEWSDFVCLAAKNKDGFRYLQTGETPSALAKNRYGMPNVIEFSWPAFQAAIMEGLSKTFEKKEN